MFLKNPIANVKHVVAVASGKGGVGKSTTALHLALAFQRLGKRVGILDLDIYGPSLPLLTGISEKPDQTPNKRIAPFEKFGIQIMSLGFMVDPERAVIWRGPVVQKAVKQLLHDVAWEDDKNSLDVLILDLPPGTGDVQLTLTQKIKVDGAVIVSTPQDLALIDARKAVDMFKTVEVPIWGLIENMSGIHCPKCDHAFHPFGENGAKLSAQNLNIPFLGHIPLDMDLRVACDSGTPNGMNTDTPLNICEKYDMIVNELRHHF